MARIRANSKTDLVVAPHYDHLYEAGVDPLWTRLRHLLSSGEYESDLPILLSVPKPRGFNRPGGILNPFDRVAYQLSADQVSVVVEGALDRSRVFSNRLLDPDPDGRMFERDTYPLFQTELSLQGYGAEFFVKLDIANYYDRIPQHSLVNMLWSDHCDPRLVNFLEKLLLAFQQNQSTGLVQGLFPSDLLGNYYLSSFDAQCAMREVMSLRFVDDIYLVANSYAMARPLLTWAVDQLRRDGLHVNEGKSGIMRSDDVEQEEDEVRRLFAKTIAELHESGFEHAEVVYAFRVDIEQLVESVGDPTAASFAINRLLSDTADRPDLTAKVDKYAIPILAALKDDSAINRAVEGIVHRPYLAQIYAVYLSRFVDEVPGLSGRILGLISREDVGTYERMVLLASLQNCASLDERALFTLLNLMTSPQQAEPIRALAAILAAKFGAAAQQRAVKQRYGDEGSAYMRAALLYSAQWMSAGDKATCRRVWGSHSALNGILASTI